MRLLVDKLTEVSGALHSAQSAGKVDARLLPDSCRTVSLSMPDDQLAGREDASWFCERFKPA